MTDELLQEMLAHARQEAPRESCGVVIVWKGRERYVPCRNRAQGSEHFEIHPEDYAAAEEQGEVVTIVHSHPTMAPQPSQADLVSCETSGVPWVIVNPITGAWQRCEPSGYEAPLVGRVFSFGVLDCYSLIRDYYRRELRIELRDVARQDGFWRRGEQVYLENFARVGFARVDDRDLRPHDLVLMQLSSDVVNHGAVYLGGDRILHHVMHRLSTRDVYGGYWRQVTAMTIRHEALR